MIRACLLVFLLACGGDAPRDFAGEPYAILPTEHLSVDLRTAPSQPPVRGENSLRLKVVDRSGAPVSDLDLRVTAIMPAHGHGASAPAMGSALGNGEYLVEGLVLGMSGYWELRLNLSRAGTNDVAIARVEVR
jgi:hypothetical protein